MLRLFVAASLTLAFTTAALAADPSTSISLPIGDILQQLPAFLSPILWALIAWILAKIGGPIPQMIRTMLSEQLVQKALSFGVNAVPGAAPGKTLTVDVGNQVAAEAITYALTRGAPALLNWIGGEAGLQHMVLARIPLDANAQIINTGAGGMAIAPAPQPAAP